MPPQSAEYLVILPERGFAIHVYPAHLCYLEFTGNKILVSFVDGDPDEYIEVDALAGGEVRAESSIDLALRRVVMMSAASNDPS
jgi:hypothetical protein